MNCGVGCRRGLNLALLWLWCRPVATGPIGPLAWKPPYAIEVALEMAKKTKRKKKKEKKEKISFLFFLFMATYGSSLARGQIEAAAAGLHLSCGNAGSEPHL